VAKDLIPREYIDELRAAQAALHKAAPSRPIDERRTAQSRFHWALKAIWYPGLCEAVWLGSPEGTELRIRFLEQDPWFFRSGYAKQRAIKTLKREDLSDKQLARLRKVCLAAVDGHDRTEFRDYCRLAQRVQDQDLVEALKTRRHSPDEGIRRRASWMLERLR